MIGYVRFIRNDDLYFDESVHILPLRTASNAESSGLLMRPASASVLPDTGMCRNGEGSVIVAHVCISLILY